MAKTKTKAKKIALLTNCTATSNYPPMANIVDMPAMPTMDGLIDVWSTAINGAKKDHPKELRTPGELYSGVSFSTVTEIAQIIGHEHIFVVNRGTGLVQLDTKMVPYNFSYDKDDPESAYHKVTGEKFIPGLWWSKINKALHDMEFPISTMLKDYDNIVVALPVGFIRLVSRDIARMTNIQDRVFIPVPQSNIVSVPRVIRHACIPYSAAYTRDVEYSKYTKCHAMAHKFLTVGLEDGNLVRHANAVRDAQHALTETRGSDSIDHTQIFKENPELLKAHSAESAFARAKAKGLRPGSRTRFVGAWRGAQGTQHLEIDKDTLSSAQNALRTVIQNMESSHSTVDELLTRVGTFVAAVEAEDPTMVFTSKDVAAWGKIAYDIQEERPKGGVGSSNKVSGILRSYTQYLGLEQIMVGTTKAYRIAS